MKDQLRRATTSLRDSSWWRLYRAHDLKHRPRGPLDGAHNEWSVIYTPPAAEMPRRLVDLVLDAAASAADWDLRSVIDRHPGRTEVDVWPGEHYKLLPALARSWGAKTVVEVGTYRGASALALSTEPSIEQIVTFDLLPWSQFDPTYLTTSDVGARIQQELGDLADPSVFALHAPLINSAEMLFIDAPKDGVFEPRFVELLLRASPSVDQLVVFDDIRVLTMIELWRGLPLEKLDATSLGHWSGTGLAIRRAGAA